MPELPPLPQKLICTFRGGWLDGLEVDAVQLNERPSSYNPFPDPLLGLISGGQILWHNTGGGQLGAVVYRGVAGEVMRMLSNGATIAEIQARGMTMNHEYAIAERTETDDGVTLVLQHRLLKPGG
jgi:hypothetical protein